MATTRRVRKVRTNVRAVTHIRLCPKGPHWAPEGGFTARSDLCLEHREGVSCMSESRRKVVNVARVRALAAQGLHDGEIAMSMGVDGSSTISRIRRLAGIPSGLWSQR